MKRNQEIVKVSVYGILVNILLVGFKGAVGLAANSIAIILDAVNNFTDAFSSIVTIVGIKLSEKRPDKKHPFGYGRIEYFSAVLIAGFVLVAGVMSLKESIEKIVTPGETDYSVITLVIIMVAVLVKFFFGRYVKRKGEVLESGSLVASGVDALSDAVLSFSVFVAALLNFVWQVSLEGYLGVVISVMIVRTAMEIMKKAIDDIIGVRVDVDLVKKLKQRINRYPGVLGVYDVTIHNYGPNRMIGSVHIQVNDEMRAGEIHRLARRIEVGIYEKMGIILTVGIYASNNKGEYGEIQKYLKEILGQYRNVLQMHGFYVDEETKMVSFDLIFDFEEREPEEECKEIVSKLKKRYPKYDYSVIIDTDAA